METLFKLPVEMDFYIRHITPEFGHWFAGFCDGEAHLQARAVHIGLAHSCMVRLAIILRADDFPVLQYVKSNLGCGNLTRYADRRPTRSPMCVFNVARVSDLMCIVVPALSKYPMRAKKAQEFPLWARAAEISYASSRARMTVSGKHRLNQQDWDEFCMIEQKLREMRKYNELQIPSDEEREKADDNRGPSVYQSEFGI